jgi:hypothetical protein
MYVCMYVCMYVYVYVYVFAFSLSLSLALSLSLSHTHKGARTDKIYFSLRSRLSRDFYGTQPGNHNLTLLEGTGS